MRSSQRDLGFVAQTTHAPLAAISQIAPESKLDSA
jgi:hypothetical protein